ncbi:MAG: hypothetical protein RLZZ444_1561 [Pseudomonadota bacterium]
MTMENAANQNERNPDIDRIGTAMARMRLMIGRRYIGRVAIARLDAGMELSDLDVLSLVNRLGRDREITIGTVAENMRVDHSRASRVVADLVKRGMLKREVSQEDARRTIVALTAEGRTYVDRVHDIKQDVLSTALADWPAEDIAEFARLYNRFMLSMEQQANAFDDEQSKSS